MKKTGMILFILLLMLSLSTGCSNQENSITESNNTTDNNLEQISNKASQSDADMFTDRDYRTAYDENESILIHLNGDSATASSNSVKISGSTVQITEEATYIISGTLNNGIILVDAEDTAKLQIVLNGVSITNESSAALYILSADKVFVTLAEGTENTLANGGSFIAIDENNIDAVVFSKQDLTFNGTGNLIITSPNEIGRASCRERV